MYFKKIFKLIIWYWIISFIKEKIYKYFIVYKNGNRLWKIEYGKNGMSNYLKYQSREDRWIFYKKDKGWQYKGHSYRDHDDNEFFTWEFTDDPNKCWENYQGERKQYFIFPEYNGMIW